MQVQMIMRSEILDAATCDVCASLDGIMRPADDPAWGGELGMLAHCNCRMMLIPIFEGIPTVMVDTPIEEINQIKQMLGGSLVTQEILNTMKIPTRGVNRFTMHTITEKDIEDIFEPVDLILRLFGIEE